MMMAMGTELGGAGLLLRAAATFVRGGEGGLYCIKRYLKTL